MSVENVLDKYKISRSVLGAICTKNRCYEDNCDKKPYFNLPGSKNGLYCCKHKTEEMIDIINKRCTFLNCNKQPAYNLPGSKIRLYCSKHKTENMVDVKSKRCIELICEKIPSFNIEGSKNGIYCSKHKTEEMIDVVHPRCKELNCEKIPSYNLLGSKNGIYCSKHKTENMIDIVSRRCTFLNCEKQPSYNLPGSKIGLYCNTHKTEEMIDVKNPKCTSCKLFRVDKGTNFLCVYCNPFSSKARRTKEAVIESLLTDNGIIFINNKQFGNTCCLKYRPDFLIKSSSYYLIVEVDENAHKQYPVECEMARMNLITIGLSC